MLVLQCRRLQWAHLNVQLATLPWCNSTLHSQNVRDILLLDKNFGMHPDCTVNFIWPSVNFCPTVRCFSTSCITCCCLTRRLTQKTQTQMSDPRIHRYMFGFSDSLCLKSPPHLAVRIVRSGDQDNSEKKPHDKLLRHWHFFYCCGKAITVVSFLFRCMFQHRCPSFTL